MSNVASLTCKAVSKFKSSYLVAESKANGGVTDDAGLAGSGPMLPKPFPSLNFCRLFPFPPDSSF